MTGFTIRSSTPFDLNAILQIERCCPTAAHWNEPAYRQLWGSPQPERVGFVAVGDDGSVLGFLVAREIAGEWELENVAVAAATQHRGIGRALLHRLFEVIAGAKGSRLFLEVRESNLPARRLYQSQGFQLTGNRKNYYNDPPEDALLFEKKFDNLSMKIR